jgi:hypothetical protein
MPDIDPASTFRGLPLTSDQDSEIKHYIKGKVQKSEQWDTSELAAMIEDMLEPPAEDELELVPTIEAEKQIEERAASTIDEAMEPIEADEELRAAMESETMKGP